MSEIPNEILPIITSKSGMVTPAELSMVTNEIKHASRPRKNYNKNIPDKMKVKISEYAILHGTKAALEHFSKIHPKFKCVRTSVNNWKLGILKKRKIDCKNKNKSII